MTYDRRNFTPTQIRIAKIIAWLEKLQEAITAYRFKIAFAKAQIEVQEELKKRKDDYLRRHSSV